MKKNHINRGNWVGLLTYKLNTKYKLTDAVLYPFIYLMTFSSNVCYK